MKKKEEEEANVHEYWIWEKQFLYLNKLLKNWQKTCLRSLIFWAYFMGFYFYPFLSLKIEIPKEEWSDLL